MYKMKSKVIDHQSGGRKMRKRLERSKRKAEKFGI
jgi:hypothetical protein